MRDHFDLKIGNKETARAIEEERARDDDGDGIR